MGLPGERSPISKASIGSPGGPVLQHLCGTSGREEEGWEAGRLGYPGKENWETEPKVSRSADMVNKSPRFLTAFRPVTNSFISLVPTLGLICK